jgi:hypothetical protein
MLGESSENLRAIVCALWCTIAFVLCQEMHMGCTSNAPKCVKDSQTGIQAWSGSSGIDVTKI